MPFREGDERESLQRVEDRWNRLLGLQVFVANADELLRGRFPHSSSKARDTRD
jgi:hypothetical protein